jgi:hypothetical protein
MTTNNPDASRKDFETWYQSKFEIPVKFQMKANRYEYGYTQIAWEAWQAARSDKGEAVGKIAHEVESGVPYVQWNKGSIITDGAEVYLAAPQQAIPAGYALVPIEPTEAMVVAGCNHENMGDMAGRYKAMIAAAPTAPINDAIRASLQEMVDMIDSGDEHGAGSPWHTKAKAALAKAAPEEKPADWETIKAKADKYDAINTPEIDDFLSAVKNEALHQRERWGAEGDAGKHDADWFWLIGYLAGKAIHQPGKILHHIITTAAACLNWHAHKTGHYAKMRPGIEEPE